jgi:hypothetical protein
MAARRRNSLCRRRFSRFSSRRWRLSSAAIIFSSFVLAVRTDHRLPDEQQQGAVTFTIVSARMPPGVCTLTSSPRLPPSRARPTGDSVEMRPCAASASTLLTMVYSSSPWASRTHTLEPTCTSPQSDSSLGPRWRWGPRARDDAHSQSDLPTRCLSMMRFQQAAPYRSGRYSDRHSCGRGWTARCHGVAESCPRGQCCPWA